MNKASEQSSNTNDTENSGLAQNRQKFLKIFASSVVLIGLVYLIYWYFVAYNIVYTDNAYVDAEIAQVNALTSGVVKEVTVIDTQTVKKGDTLVVIDKIDAELTLQQAKAQLASEQSLFKRASIDLERREKLAKSGSVSGEELTNARSEAAKTKAAVELAQAKKDKAELDLERTTIKSPVNGMVVRRQVQPGQYLEPGTFLMSVVPISQVYVNANFKEVQLPNIRIGQNATIESDFYGSSVKYSGKIVGIGAGTGSAFALIPAQNATGNWIKVVQRLPVRIALNTEEIRKNPLRVGLSMRVHIDTSHKVEPKDEK